MRVTPVRLPALLTALVVAGIAMALLVAWLGVFNIAASRGHPAWMERFLELGMRRSVQQHSSELIPPPDLNSSDRIRVGAAHFAGGCAECHGAPGAPRNPVYGHMLPAPPELTRSTQWDARELFFIVRHGLQFTGMPAWSGRDRDDEVWSMVAFLQQLPALSVNEYQALAAGNVEEYMPPAIETLRDEGVTSLARAACDRCHDTAQAQPPSSLVPRLAGQSAAYLARSLQEYRSGARASGFMQPVAAMLSERQITALAQHYSRMPSGPPATSASLSAAGQAEAARLAGGNHDTRLPACLSCHGVAARADYPLLNGQNAAYIAQQLRLWQSGGRRQSAWGEVMAVIASHLDAAQIDLLARWFAQQPAPGAAE